MAIVLAERAHLQEVDVAHALVPSAIPGDRVIGDEVAGHQLEFFQEERVGRACIDWMPPTVGQRKRVLVAAVDAISQCKRLHSVVVRRRDRDGDFLDIRDFRVAARLDDLHRGGSVGQRLHRILHGARNAHAIGCNEVHAIESRGLHGEGGRQQAVCANCKGNPAPVVEREDTTAHWLRDRGVNGDNRPYHSGDVTPFLDVVCRKARVCGIAEIDRQRAECRKVGDAQRVCRRADSVRINEVLRGVRDVEHTRREMARHRVARHRQSHPLG